MFKIESIFAIVALCYFLGEIYADIEMTKKPSKEFPTRELLFSDYAFKEAVLVYATCDKQTKNQVMTCTVYQEVSPYKKVSRQCDMTIDVKNIEYKLRDIFIGALNPDKAIIVYEIEDTQSQYKQYNRVRIGTIDLNKCTINVEEFFDKKGYKSAYWQLKNERTIVPYKNFYDAFYASSTGEIQECKTRISAEGKYMEKFANFTNGNPLCITQFSSINSTSSDKGYIYRKFNQLDESVKYYSYIMRKSDESETILTTSPKDMKYDIISASNNKINVYFKATGQNGNMTLLQYDAVGNNVLTTNLPDIGNSKQVLNIYNLPEGGSILLIDEVEDATVECSKVKSFHLVKIDTNGKKVGEIQLQGLDSETFYETSGTRYRRHIWKNKQGGYCATIVGPTVKCTGSDVSQANDMQIIENCFTDDDFSK